jgi:serine/threonine protein kinase
MKGELIGKSLYSKVFEYNHSALPENIAVKISHGIGVHFDETEMIANERIRGSLHPDGFENFIVKYHGITDEGHLLFERADSTLEDVDLPPSELGSMIGQIANGIELLDELRINHRDLRRPPNIFVFSNGGKNEYKIGDFNISEIVDPGEDTSNVLLFRAAVRVYVGTKILGFENVADSYIDVAQELEDSNVPVELKRPLLELFRTEKPELDDLRHCAISLYDSNLDWDGTRIDE